MAMPLLSRRVAFRSFQGCLKNSASRLHKRSSAAVAALASTTSSRSLGMFALHNAAVDGKCATAGRDAFLDLPPSRSPWTPSTERTPGSSLSSLWQAPSSSSRTGSATAALQPLNPAIPCITDMGLVPQELRHGSQEEWQQLLDVARISHDDPQAFMVTHGLHNVISRHELYRLTDTGLESSSPGSAGDVDVRVLSHPSPMTTATTLPSRHEAIVRGMWKTRSNSGVSHNNILGDNHEFVVSSGDALEVPFVTATEETLAPFGAVLLRQGETLQFANDDCWPVFHMSIGKNYLDGYLLREDQGGDGLYIEFHKNRPHLHYALSADAGGYYLLGRFVSGGFQPNQPNTLAVTAFRIEPGTAIYTPPGVLHSDAGLTGPDWIVAYDSDKDFACALLRDNDGHFVQVNTCG